MRTARFAALAALILTVGVSAPASAAAAAPKINSLTASHNSVSGNKATKVTVKASLSHAASCTLRSQPAISGLPKTTACTTSFAKTVTVPANTSGTGRTFTLTLKATKSGKSASRAVTVKQSGATPPNVVISAKPTSLTAAGGNVTIRGTVTHAKTCTLTSKPNLGSKKGSCSSGTIIKAFTVPTNTSGSSRFFAFMVKAAGPGGSTTGTLLLRQPAGPVAVTLITSSPASLSADGGPLTVHGTVTGAKTCTIKSTPDIGSGSVPCKDGTLSRDFTVHPNRGASSKPYSFTLKAVGPGGTASGTLTLNQPAAPAAPVNILSFNASPASLPAGGTDSLTVSATLTGANQCQWTMDSLPPSPPEACTTSSSHNFGAIAANPGPGAATHTFTLDVTGQGSGTASETLTMSQPPLTASGPSITSITPSPDHLTADGGTLNIALAVHNADTCTITGNNGVAPVTHACSTGSYNHDFAIPANTTDSDITYTFDVTATSGANSATGSLTMTQPAAVPPGPAVTSMTSSPKTVDYQGGMFTVTAHVVNAAQCTMTSSPDEGSKGSTDCSDGTFTATVTLPQNNSASSVKYTVTVHVTGPGGLASGTLTYYVPPKPS